MKFNSSWSLQGRTKRFFNRFIDAFILAASGVLLTACVSSSGGGGGGAAAPSAPSRVGVFSHAAYDFVLLNTTQAGRNQSPVGERRLGLIQVEEAEIRARLPEGAVWQPADVRYTIVGGTNDLTRAFFKLEAGNRAMLLFEAAPRYASRTFTLDYVVNTLGVDALRVVANVSYVDARGARQTLGLYEVPVTMRAVAEVPAANDFVVFDGIKRSGTEQRDSMVTTTMPDQSFQGRLSQTINLLNRMGVARALDPFTDSWGARHYTPDPAEVQRADTVAAFDGTQLITSAAPRQTRPALAVTVTLTLNNNSDTQVSGRYAIAAGTNISVVNGNSSVGGSFLAFLQGLNATHDLPLDLLDANDRVGLNVTAMAWSFTFPYMADVTTTTTTTRPVRVSRVAYTAEGAIDENVAGRTSLSRSAEILRTLGIRLNRPAGFEGPLPTLYFQVANANVSAAHCETAFYLDQGYRHYQNYQIKAQASPNAARPLLNHEARDAYACQMEVSLRGTDSSYRAITTGNLTDTNNQTTAVAGTAVDLNVVTCGSANATTRLQALRTAPGCIYRADVDIAVRDRNEPVEFNFEVGVMDALDEANVGLAEAQDMSVGTPLNTSASDPVLATFTYREPDQNATGGRLDVAVPQIMSVVPAQVQPTGAVGLVATAPLFYIEPRADDRAALMLNASVAASVLDYEALATNATGQRSLRVILQATDNSTARLVTERVFHLEVQDVVYAPVDLTYVPQVHNSTEGPPAEQLLLPGFAQFVANGGPVLGQMQAVDPETNTSAGLSYAYVGVAPLPADRANRAVLEQVPLWNASFTLGQNPGRPTADELLLVGVGLRAGAAFNVQLQARHESPRANVTGDVVPVRTMVAYDAVNITETYGGEPPIKFNTGTFLGFVAEGRPGAEVYNSTGQPRTKLGHLLVAPADDNRAFSIMTPTEITDLMGILESDVQRDVQRALASRLAVLSGPEQFKLNQTTGALSLQAAADFTTQPVHMLLLRVADRRVPVPAAYPVSDYALVQVVVEDTNTAPALMNLRAVHETVSTTSSLVRLTDLPEDTPAGTVLATLQVRDDNPLTGVNFAPAAGATAYTIERTAASRRVAATASEAAHYLASYRLVTVAPDYEANATLDVVHELVDNGRYGYDPLRQMVVRSAPSLVNTTRLRVNASVVDVNEAPVVRFMQSRVDVAENADQGDAVVTVRAEDPEGLVANLTYALTTVPASLAAAFNVTEVGATVTHEGRVATWALEVADADALENAGDGQIFTLTLTATDESGARTSASLVITVLDVPAVLDVTAVNTTLLELSEQQALDDPARVLRAPLFRLADVQPDYDEYFFGLGPNDPGPAVRFGELAFAPGAIGYVDARGMSNATITDELHNEERFNLFILQEENAAVNLVLGEAGLIEPHLLGRHVRLEVRLRDPAGTGPPQTVQVPVAIVPTQPAGLRFADGRNLDASLVPAVYTFEYDQTPYAEHLSDGACTPDNATQLTYDGRCYPTEQVRVDANSAPVLYVRRDVAKQEVLDAPATVLSVNNTFGLLLREGANLTDSAIQVYTLDAAGNLAAGDFETYFQYRLNTSYAGVNRTALLIEQKRHAVLYANGSGVNPDAHYAALDTLPLDSREGNQQRVLSFFFVAGDGATNASRRAIAQMNVEVKSAGLNVRASVTQLRLGDISFPVGPGVNKRIRFAENGAGAVGFPVNVVNNPNRVLTITIENPDSAERNQTVRATVDVVVVDTDTNDPAMNGTLDVSAGTASGNALVRLGRNADAQHLLTVSPGVRNATRPLSFQLARNVHGRAYIRVRFEERDDQDQLVEDDPYYEYFLLEVTRVDEVASRITDIRVANASSPVNEDGFGTASPQLNITLTNEQFRSPRNLDLIGVNVDATNSLHAGLVVAPAAMAEVVVPVGRINVQHVLQDLNYAMHAHGTTTFTVRARPRERRGFADELHTYGTGSFTRAFRVTAINDPLLPSPRAETATRYVLQTQFDEGNRLNQFVEGIGEAVVFVTDVDLATNGSVPASPMFTFPAQPLGNSSTMINPSDVRVSNADVTAAGTDVRVAFPIELRLSQAQYDAILLQEGGFDLNMTVVLRDGDDPTLVVNITKPLIAFSVSTDDAVLASVGGYTGALNVNEATAEGEVLSLAAINITDPDIQRASGDVYTYGLDVARTRDGVAVSDLLAWRDVDDRQAATDVRRLTRRASAFFLSALQLAKTPQDADVGSYEVNWTISEAQSTTGFPRAIANGTLLVHIANVNDALAVAAIPAPTASAYHLQQDFGVRTLRERGMQLRADKVVRASFTDDDLLLASAAGQLPTVDDVSIVGTTVLAGAPVQVAIDTRNASGVEVRAVGGNRLQVTVPVNVTLTPAQYDAINRNGTASIAFTLTVRDGNTTVGPRPAANATGSFAVMAGPNDVILDEKIEEGAMIQIPTNTAQYTQVGANFVLNDPEIRRTSGDTFTYRISSDHNDLARSFLEWGDGLNAVAMQETVAGQSQDTVRRLLRTSRALTDAEHAGFYNVSWSINDGETQLGSYFRLNVTDVNDPLVATSVANATYSLRADFDAAGNLTAAIQDLVFFFTDADLATASSTAARGGAASVPNVLDLRPELGALTSTRINGTAITNAPDPDTRLVFGTPTVTQVGTTDTLRVAVPVNLNLTQAQYDALLGTGGQNFHMHVILDNRDVYGTTDGTTTSKTATLVLRDFGIAARARIPADTYDGGDVAIYREQARLAHTLGAGAVFLNGTHRPQRINITDADFQSASGDTYMYHLNVTDSSTGARITNLLEWDVPATESIQQSSPNVLRVLRYQNRAQTDPRGPQPGVYTVAWSITEARGGTTLNRQVAGGTFILTIRETPAPQLQPIANQVVMEGRTDQLNITVAFVESIPGDVTVNISHTPAFVSGRLIERRLALFPEDASGVTRLLEARNGRVTFGGNAALLITGALDDPDVRTYQLNVTAATTDVAGARQSDTMFFNLTVANVNDPTVSLPRPMSGYITVSRGGRFTIGSGRNNDDELRRIAFFDDDLKIPGAVRPDLTAFDSNLKLGFTADGDITRGICEIPRAVRPIANLAPLARTDKFFFSIPGLSLTDCRSDDIPAGIDNLYELSQNRTVHLFNVSIDNHAEIAGPMNQRRVIEMGRGPDLRFAYEIPYFTPYTDITTSDALRANLTAAPDGIYRLAANLNLTSWTPISNFGGLLEGDNNTITFAAGATGPFFASINSSGMVQNLGILNSTLAAVNNGTILGSYATGNRSCTAFNCDSGGLVDQNNGAIIDSHARGNSSCAATGCDSGGLVGLNTGSITGSYALGTSACNGAQCGSGGLVSDNEGPILRSYALGDVTCSGSSDATGGGLVGINRNTVTRSYAIGDIVCSGSVLVGGLIGAGRGNAVVRQSYATGNGACMGSFCAAGGLVGALGSAFNLIQSYAAGNSTCTASSCLIDGITGGRLTVAHEITESYKAQNAGSGGIHRTLAQLRCPTMANQTCQMGTNTYVGWDESVWNFGTANDLPTLHHLPACPTFRPNCRH